MWECYIFQTTLSGIVRRKKKKTDFIAFIYSIYSWDSSLHDNTKNKW